MIKSNQLKVLGGEQENVIIRSHFMEDNVKVLLKTGIYATNSWKSSENR